MAIQRPVQRLRRRIVVRAGASLRLRHDLLDHAHRHDLARGQLQLLRGLDLAGVVAPHDGGGRLGRRDRIDRVLEHDHPVRDAHAQRAAAPALADHRRDYWDRNAEPIHDRVRDRGGDAALFSAGSGIGAGRVDQRDDRKTELRRVVGEPKRLAVTLGMHHPPVPRHALFEAAALLVAEEDRRPPVPCADSADQRRIVSRQPIAMQLDEIGREAPDVVERVRAVRMSRELDDLPHAHEYISSRCASKGRSSVRGTTMSTCP